MFREATETGPGLPPNPRVALEIPESLLGRQLGRDLGGEAAPAVGSLVRVRLGDPVAP